MNGFRSFAHAINDIVIFRRNEINSNWNGLNYQLRSGRLIEIHFHCMKHVSFGRSIAFQNTFVRVDECNCMSIVWAFSMFAYKCANIRNTATNTLRTFPWIRNFIFVIEQTYVVAVYFALEWIFQSFPLRRNESVRRNVSFSVEFNLIWLRLLSAVCEWWESI